MAKYKGHISTGDYEFIEVENDDIEELLKDYKFVKQQYYSKTGYNQLEWARIRDRVSNNEVTDIEEYQNILNGANVYQKYFLNQLKLVNRRNNG